MSQNTFDIVYELRQRQHEFSPVEARIAAAILADVDAAAQYGVSELAERAEVSAAAISRFAKALGCEHVRELRARLASASAVGKRFLEQQNAPPVSALYAQIELKPGFLMEHDKDVCSFSQAPSPESNPNSPSPVTTIVGHYPTIES